MILVGLWRFFIPLQLGPFLSVSKWTGWEGGVAGTELNRSGQSQLLSSQVTAGDVMGKMQSEPQTFHVRQHFMCGKGLAPATLGNWERNLFPSFVVRVTKNDCLHCEVL